MDATDDGIDVEQPKNVHRNEESFQNTSTREKKNPTNQRFVMHVIKSITPKMNAHKLGAAWKFFHFNFVICRLIIFRFFFCDACS